MSRFSDDKPKQMEDQPGTRAARGRDKYCCVMGAECWDGGSYDPPEPPEYWYPYQEVVAKTKREAILKVLANPDDKPYRGSMKQYIDEVRGEGLNPMWALWVQYLGVVGEEENWDEMYDELTKALDLDTADETQPASEQTVQAQ